MPITYDRDKLFAAVRGRVFGGHISDEQVKGVEAIVDAWQRLQPSGDTRYLAYMLATAKWETEHTMQPVRESGFGHGRKYGYPAGPYHQIYYGRGYVQLTWLEDYELADKELRALGLLKADESLVRTPDLALRPDIAAAILIYGMLRGWFTTRKLETYFTAAHSDWLDARRIVNGTDHDAEVAAIAEGFYAGLKVARITAAAA